MTRTMPEECRSCTEAIASAASGPTRPTGEIEDTCHAVRQGGRIAVSTSHPVPAFLDIRRWPACQQRHRLGPSGGQRLHDREAELLPRPRRHRRRPDRSTDRRPATAQRCATSPLGRWPSRMVLLRDPVAPPSAPGLSQLDGFTGVGSTRSPPTMTRVALARNAGSSECLGEPAIPFNSFKRPTDSRIGRPWRAGRNANRVGGATRRAAARLLDACAGIHSDSRHRVLRRPTTPALAAAHL